MKLNALKQDAPDRHNQWYKGVQILQNRSHLKNLGCRSVTCSKVRAEDPKMIGNTLCSPGLVFGKWHGIDWAHLETVWT
jgi:hypothetical protein